ncbi:MAG: TonB-dependent receptor [Gammaproteobacteria bacterium]|nr:TonB-dependent receptor [Gammaproteobacteria bacterium]
MFEKTRLAAAVAAAAGLAVAVPVHAQGAPAPAERRMLEEIVVTAARREQDIQDVAVTVTAITGDVLQRAFAQDATGLNGIAPNVQLLPVGAFPNASAFYIRGVGSTDIESATEPGIAVFVNDIYQGRTSTALTDFLDIESVEILRGPQGTLFGRNAAGGVVQINQAQPEFGAQTLDVGVMVGNYGRRNVSLVGNTPLSDDVALRVAGKFTSSDGYYSNQHPTGGSVSGNERITLMPSLKWQVSDDLEVLLRGEYNRTRDDSQANVPWNACRQDPATAAPFPNTFVTGVNDLVVDAVANVFGDVATAQALCAKPIRGDSFKVAHNQERGNFADFDVWGLSANVSYLVPELGRFTYIGSYREVDEDVYNDFDTTPYFIFETRRDQAHWQFSHELRYNADLSEDFELVLGAYYFEQDYDLKQDTFGLLAGPTQNIFGRSRQDHRNVALFGQLDYRLTDELVLIAGLRWDNEKKGFNHCGVGAGSAALRICEADFGAGPVDTTISGSQTWSNLSPKLGAQYFFSDDLMGYATWSRAFRSGGFNGRATSPTTIGPFDEEQADNFEVGMKSAMLDGRMRANLSLFWLDYKDLQRPVIRPNPSGGAGQETITENVGKARNRGAELELTALLTPRLSLDLSLGYLDASNQEFCAPLHGVRPVNEPPDGFTQCAPSLPVLNAAGDPTGFLVPIDATDLDPPQSPKWTTRVGLVFEQPIDQYGNLTLAASWRFQSGVSAVGAGLPPGTDLGITNFDGSRVDARRKSNDVIDLSATWRSPDERYRVAAFVKNLTDEQYLSTGTFVAGLFNFIQFNPPRHYGLEVSMALGQ